jgi:hypothetical protein
MNDDELRALARSALGSVGPADGADGTDEVLASLRSKVAAGVAAEDSRPLAALRRRPGWQRNLVGLAALVTLVVATRVAMPRADLAVYPTWRLALELTVYVAAFGLASLVALRGAHLPTLPRLQTYALVVATVGLVALVGMLPAPHAHSVPASRGAAELLSGCALMGVMVALPVYALVRSLDRGSSLSAIAAAAAAGLAGNAFLQMRCANTSQAHLVFGHAAVGVWLVAGVALVRAVERRRAK